MSKNARTEADYGIQVFDRVLDKRTGHVRWVVVGTFTFSATMQPRCVEYRVRVVPVAGSKNGSILLARTIEKELARDGEPRDRPDHWIAGETSGPPEGIPQRVFEEASQFRLLVKARARIAAVGSRAYRREVQQFLASKRRTTSTAGRPATRALEEKLRILASVDDAYATGRTLEAVAADHHVSRSTVRDIVAWARRDARPQLFTSSIQGARGGQLTPAARELIEKGALDDGQH